MIENVCKNCNAPLDMAEAKNGVIACSFCGSVFTLPKKDASDKVRKHLDAGETALDQCRFDDALASYTKAIEADGSEPEGYWGRALARFRVQYLRDTVNNRLQPICHEVSEESFTSDPDYRKALTLATEEQRAEYAKKGEEIDYIRSEFYALERTGLKYDCFICVKVTEEDGGHTEDSFAALKLYNALKKAGYKPFFSEEEMGERTGADYEALRLYALKSAGSLLIVCSDKRYLETKWVKNEYTRYAAMLTDEEKERGSMAIVYLGKPIEKLPGIKGKLQGVDYRQFDAMDRIRAFIDSHDEGKRREREERAAKERAEKEREAKEKAAAEQSAIEAMQAELERMRETLSARESGTAPAAPVTPAPPVVPAPAATYALSDFEIADGVLVQYKGKETDVVIPAGIGITKIGIKAFRKLANLRSVTIPEGVTEICGGESGKYETKVFNGYVSRSGSGHKAGAFSGSGLQEVTLPGSLTTIAAGAFSDCYIRRVTIPDSVTEIGDEAFAGCTLLADITLGRGIKKLGWGAFRKCRSLTEVTLPGTITETGGLFMECAKLVKATIPDSVTEIGRSTFAECTSLAGVTFGRNVRTIGQSAFEHCTSLTKVMIPDSVTEIGCEAFIGCTSLAEVTFGRNVKTIGQNAFRKCTSLKAVTIPDGVTEIGDEAFADCASLAEVTFGRGVTKIGDEAFAGCTSLAKVTMSAGVTKIGDEAFGVCPIETVRLPESLTAIGSFAFACNAMEEVYIPYAVETIGKCAFGKKGNLRIRCAASGPSPGWEWNWAYNGENKNATAVKYGLGSKDSYTGFETKAFPVEWRVSPDGSPLTETDTRAFTIQGKTLVKYSGKQSKVVVPAGIEKIGSEAFSGCQAERIELPDSVTEFDKGAFAYGSFTEITIPKGVKTIPEECFRCCTGLQSIELPEGVEKIEKNAFRGYRDGSGISYMKLSSVRLPDSLREIDDAAFYGCPLQDVLIPEGVTRMGCRVFGMEERAAVSVKVARKKPLFRLPDGWPMGWCTNAYVKWNVKRP